MHRLTGTLVTDPSDASGTDAYDQVAGEWSDAAPRRGRDRPGHPPAGRRVDDRRRRADAGRGRPHRAAGGHPGRPGRGRRPHGRRRGRRHHPGRRRLRLPRVVLVDLGLLHPAAARPRHAVDDLQPRRPGPLRAHGDHAGRRREPELGRGSPRRGRRRVRGPAAAGGQGPGRGRGALLPALPARRAVPELERGSGRGLRRSPATSRRRPPGAGGARGRGLQPAHVHGRVHRERHPRGRAWT